MATDESPSTEPPPLPTVDFDWHKVADLDELPEGRVKTVAVGRRSLALSNLDGQYGAPRQPLPAPARSRSARAPSSGDGSAARGTGTTSRPSTGSHRAGSATTRPASGPRSATTASTSPCPARIAHPSNGLRRGGRDAHELGPHPRVRHGRPLQPGAGRRPAEGRGTGPGLTYIGIRHEGAAAFAAVGYGKLTGRPAACLGIAGPGSTNMLTGLYDAKADRAPGAGAVGPGAVPRPRAGRVPGHRPRGRVQRRGPVQPDRCRPVRDHGELATLAMKTAIVERDVAHLVFPDEVQHAPAHRRARVGSPDGRTGSDEVAAPEAEVERAAQQTRRGRTPADRRGQRCPPRDGGDHGAGRPAGDAGRHHVQGQGPHQRHPSRSAVACWAAAAPPSPVGS